MYGTVYLITNAVNGKMYVGQTTKNLEERFNQHAKNDSPIGNAIRKYGAENFSIEPLKHCYSKAELDAWEKFFIAMIHCKAPFGYNLTDGGEGLAGWHHKPETLAKMSESQSGKTRSEEARANIAAAKVGEKNPFFGKKHTPESLALMSAAHKGKPRSRETRANISAALTGREFSPEHCANIAAAKKGVIPSDDTRDKMAEARVGEKNHNFGKPRDSKTCAKIGASQRGYTPFKNLLKELDARQMTYAAFAKILGINSATVSEKMTCRKNFTDKDKVTTSEFFGKPIEYLFERDESDRPLVKKPHRRESPYKNLIAELDARNLSYAAFAKLMGMDKNSLARKIRDDRSFMDKEKNRFAEFFGKPVKYLFKRDD